MPMGAGCERRRTSLGAWYFSSPCPARKGSSWPFFRRLTARERRAKTPYVLAMTKTSEHMRIVRIAQATKTKRATLEPDNDDEFFVERRRAE
jgi:hypothetical protein